MAREHTGEARLTAVVPESLERWLAEQADGVGVEVDEYLVRLLAACRLATEEGEAVAPGEIARLDGRLDDLRADYEEALADVRNRVVDVKLEADDKAPIDHDHAELRERADRLAHEVDSLAEAVEENGTRLDEGFENYREVLEYLTDATDDIEERIDALARATIEAREQSRAAVRRMATRAAADELARRANRRGVRRAKCGECRSGVDVALLTAPECPFCNSTFGDVETREGLGKLFGSAELVVGEPPALAGAVEPDEEIETVLADVVDADPADPPSPGPAPGSPGAGSDEAATAAADGGERNGGEPTNAGNDGENE